MRSCDPDSAAAVGEGSIRVYVAVQDRLVAVVQKIHDAVADDGTAAVGSCVADTGVARVKQHAAMYAATWASLAAEAGWDVERKTAEIETAGSVD